MQDIDGKFPSCYLKVGVIDLAYTEPMYLLHEAVKGGLSTHLIKLLIQAFPEGCTTKDNDLSLEVLSILLNLYPEAVRYF